MSGASVSSTSAVSGKVMRQAADLQGTVEAQCAAEAQLEARIDKLRSLLRTAVEGMGDAAPTGVSRSCCSKASAERRTCRITGSPAARASSSCAT
jgi:hypothetical protein